MKRIGIFYHPLKDAACVLAKQVTAFLRERRLAVWLCSAWDWQRAFPQIVGTDLILSIGGDGTILRAAQAVMPHSIPIAGINLGRLGFMSELSVNETIEKLPLLLEDKGHIDERSVLEAQYEAAGREPRHFYALNDIVVARGATARLINVNAIIDGMSMATLRADGVVVATATGCTGYALGAGGPILHPHSPDKVLAPLLPHLSFSYPVVLPATSVCKLTLEDPTPGIVSIDGHITIDIACGDAVTVKSSASTVRFLRVHDSYFYSSLEQRLKGKQPDDARS
jgi:NAD+ kinase